MRITLLGTGGPQPDPQRQGPATLVETDGEVLLFDAGRSVATQLSRVGVAAGDLSAVFVTHHHFDHIGGLGDLLLAEWNSGRIDPLPVFGPPGTESIVSALWSSVYDRDIDFRIAEERLHGREPAHPVDLFPVRDVVEGEVAVGRATVRVGVVDHGGEALGLDADRWTAVGYRIEAQRSVATVSGDAVPSGSLIDLALGADALVMCAYLDTSAILTEEDRFLTERVLGGASQAVAVASSAGVKRLVLTHIRWDQFAAESHLSAGVFGGEVWVGHDLMSIDV
jgi:ribonuclease Z